MFIDIIITYNLFGAHVIDVEVSPKQTPGSLFMHSSGVSSVGSNVSGRESSIVSGSTYHSSAAGHRALPGIDDKLGGTPSGQSVYHGSRDTQRRGSTDSSYGAPSSVDGTASSTFGGFGKSRFRDRINRKKRRKLGIEASLEAIKRVLGVKYLKIVFIPAESEFSLAIRLHERDIVDMFVDHVLDNYFVDSGLKLCWQSMPDLLDWVPGQAEKLLEAFVVDPPFIVPELKAALDPATRMVVKGEGKWTVGILIVSLYNHDNRTIVRVVFGLLSVEKSGF
jgi:hypothetical protein